MTVDDLGDDGSYYLGDDGSYHLGDDGSYYLDVRRPQILEARKAKAKSSREEAEASKLGGAPADDRAALDDIPMYIHRMFGEHVDEAVMDFPVEPSPAPPPPLKSEDDTASEVAYVDTDGDAIVFSRKANGKLDYFVNGAPEVTDLTSLWFDCGTLHLDGTSAGSWRSTRGTTPQNYAAARRVMSLYSLSYHPPLYGWQRPRHFCDDAVIDFPVPAVVGEAQRGRSSRGGWWDWVVVLGSSVLYRCRSVLAGYHPS